MSKDSSYGSGSCHFDVIGTSMILNFRRTQVNPAINLAHDRRCASIQLLGLKKWQQLALILNDFKDA